MTLRVERGGTGLYVFVPIEGPPGWAPGSVTAEMALVVPGTTPQSGDWHTATWQAAEARWLLQQSAFPVDGDYLLKVRLTAGAEQVVLTPGRVTLG
jgi:hypothetical protein